MYLFGRLVIVLFVFDALYTTIHALNEPINWREWYTPKGLWGWRIFGLIFGATFKLIGLFTDNIIIMLIATYITLIEFASSMITERGEKYKHLIINKALSFFSTMFLAAWCFDQLQAVSNINAFDFDTVMWVFVGVSAAVGAQFTANTFQVGSGGGGTTTITVSQKTYNRNKFSGVMLLITDLVQALGIYISWNIRGKTNLIFFLITCGALVFIQIISFKLDKVVSAIFFLPLDAIIVVSFIIGYENNITSSIDGIIVIAIAMMIVDALLLGKITSILRADIHTILDTNEKLDLSSEDKRKIYVKENIDKIQKLFKNIKENKYSDDRKLFLKLAVAIKGGNSAINAKEIPSVLGMNSYYKKALEFANILVATSFGTKEGNNYHFTKIL